jgi:hypothetical protein
MNAQRWLGMSVAWSLIVILSACRHQELGVTRDGKYEEWFSMSSNLRENYAEGFVSGYSLGSIAACNNADRLFPTNPPTFDKSGNLQLPTPRCLEAVDHYSRSSQDRANHYGVYTDAVTEFYQKYPKYRHIPYAYLLRYLSDNQYASADQLYQAFERGEIQGTF